jgi:hypothetical protein
MMARVFMRPIPLLAAALLVAAAAHAAETRTVLVRGRVLDAAGWPIGHVPVEVIGSRRVQATTDATGRYALYLTIPHPAEIARTPFEVRFEPKREGWVFARPGGAGLPGVAIDIVGPRARIRAPNRPFAHAIATVMEGRIALVLADLDIVGRRADDADVEPVEMPAEVEVPVRGVEVGPGRGERAEPGAQRPREVAPAPDPGAGRSMAARSDSIAQAQRAARAHAEFVERMRRDSIDAVRKAGRAARKAERDAARRLEQAREDSLRDARGAAQVRAISLARARADSARAADRAAREARDRLARARQDSVMAAWRARRDSSDAARRAAFEDRTRAWRARQDSIAAARGLAFTVAPRAGTGAAAQAPPAVVQAGRSSPGSGETPAPPRRPAGQSVAEAEVRLVDPPQPIAVEPPPAIRAPQPEPPDPDTCGCVIRGTVEARSERRIPEYLRVTLWLAAAQAVRDSVELFMGSPRQFELRAPCGRHRIDMLVEPRLTRYTPRPSEAFRTFECGPDRPTQWRIVLHVR